MKNENNLSKKNRKMNALKVFNTIHYSKYTPGMFPKNPTFEKVISYAKKHEWTDEDIVEIFTDLSQIVYFVADYSSYSDYGVIVTVNGNELHSGLFGGVPKHSNFFYLIVSMCKKAIPEWFFEKYVDNEDERELWIKHVR